MRYLELIIFSIFCAALLLDSTYAQSCQQTKLKPVIERVFSRKRRFLLLPKGSSLKFTAALSKHLLSSYPRGFGFAIEAAIYYPTPGTRDDIYPKRLRKPTTAAPKPKGTTEPTLVYIPGTDWRFKTKPIAKPKPVKLHRIDDVPTYWSEAGPVKIQSVGNKKWEAWGKYGQDYGAIYGQKFVNKYGQKYSEKYGQKYDQNFGQQYAQKFDTNIGQEFGQKYDQNYDQNYDSQSHQQYNDDLSYTKWTTNYDKYQNNWQHPTYTNAAKWDIATPQNWTKYKQDWHKYGQRWNRDTGKTFNEDNFETHDDERDWHDLSDSRHYHAQRDRRHLFEHFSGFSKLVGIDIKACILRAICESKRLLLPVGYSMLHDVIRVIFTMPTINGLEDEYTEIMRLEPRACAAAIAGKCHFSLLAWLLSGNLKWNQK